MGKEDQGISAVDMIWERLKGKSVLQELSMRKNMALER